MGFELHTVLRCPACGHEFHCRQKPKPTKLLSHILGCTETSTEDKMTIARLGSSQACKDFMQSTKRKAEAAEAAQPAEELQAEFKRHAPGDAAALNGFCGKDRCVSVCARARARDIAARGGEGSCRAGVSLQIPDCKCRLQHAAERGAAGQQAPLD